MFFDEKHVLKIYRSNALMSSYFACTHVFNLFFWNLSWEFIENAEIDRSHQFSDRSKDWLINQSMFCEKLTEMISFGHLDTTTRRVEFDGATGKSPNCLNRSISIFFRSKKNSCIYCHIDIGVKRETLNKYKSTDIQYF